jgi:hypothetical protein
VHSQAYLNKVARQLNERPRKTLQFETPAERFSLCCVDRLSRHKGTAMSDEDIKAELERLRSENAALKKGASDGIRVKVSEKGAVSIYGMGRFPVTLYKV